jgi:hypothetical protein
MLDNYVSKTRHCGHNYTPHTFHVLRQTAEILTNDSCRCKRYKISFKTARNNPKDFRCFIYITFETWKRILTKNSAWWDMTSCSLIDTCNSFWRIFFLFLGCLLKYNYYEKVSFIYKFLLVKNVFTSSPVFCVLIPSSCLKRDAKPCIYMSLYFALSSSSGTEFGSNAK